MDVLMSYSRVLSFGLLFCLMGCAYATESSNQYITFETPGAQDAKCYAYVEKLKYQVFPPQTINIKKSMEDMEITCDAPGNRHVELTVPSQLSKRAIWGGPVGVAWDMASESLHHYPCVIAIDFSMEELKPNKLPQHNNSDIRQPESYDLEEFKSYQPRLNSDKHKISTPLIRRGQSLPEEYMDFDEPPKNKGNLQPVAQSPTEQAPSSEAEDATEPQTSVEPQAGATNSATMQKVSMPAPQTTSLPPQEVTDTTPFPSNVPSESATSAPVSIYPGQ